MVTHVWVMTYYKCKHHCGEEGPKEAFPSLLRGKLYEAGPSKEEPCEGRGGGGMGRGGGRMGWGGGRMGWGGGGMEGVVRTGREELLTSQTCDITIKMT